jgi:hypothetical protein
MEEVTPSPFVFAIDGIVSFNIFFHRGDMVLQPIFFAKKLGE